jgi:Na+/H+ antiporter NhaA
VTLLALGEHSGGTDVAKLAILVASLTAGGLGYGLLRASAGATHLPAELPPPLTTE